MYLVFLKELKLRQYFIEVNRDNQTIKDTQSPLTITRRNVATRGLWGSLQAIEHSISHSKMTNVDTKSQRENESVFFSEEEEKNNRSRNLLVWFFFFNIHNHHNIYKTTGGKGSKIKDIIFQVHEFKMLHFHKFWNFYLFSLRLFKSEGLLRETPIHSFCNDYFELDINDQLLENLAFLSV